MIKEYSQYLEEVSKARLDEDTYNFTDDSDDTMWIKGIKTIPAQVFQGILQDSLNIAKKYKMKMRGKPGEEAFIDSNDDMDGWIETLVISQKSFKGEEFVKAKGDGQDFMNAWASMIKKKYSEYIKTSVG
jgi:hypothetical protein